LDRESGWEIWGIFNWSFLWFPFAPSPFTYTHMYVCAKWSCKVVLNRSPTFLPQNMLARNYIKINDWSFSLKFPGLCLRAKTQLKIYSGVKDQKHIRSCEQTWRITLNSFMNWDFLYWLMCRKNFHSSTYQRIQFCHEIRVSNYIPLQLWYVNSCTGYLLNELQILSLTLKCLPPLWTYTRVVCHLQVHLPLLTYMQCSCKCSRSLFLKDNMHQSLLPWFMMVILVPSHCWFINLTYLENLS
jgi:hypothetical protein